ncbi:MAG: PQQ-dependent sugar dehydrogenase [Ferruginibacter sp.]|nr:PQQ-dependent sugar dehydrogenase [Ferruginibacter sp.]
MRTFSICALTTLLIFSNDLFAQTETFTTKRVVNANTVAGRLRHPFAMVLGPDDSLWITERRGYIVRMNRFNGGKTQLLDIRNKVRFTTSFGSIKQDGMFGIALHPNLHEPGSNFVYTAYTYDSSGHRRVRIVRFTYNRATASLGSEVTLLGGIHGSDDHNAGKLVIGNFGTADVPDYKLIYTCGDRGANQFGNTCDSIESQYIPTYAQISAGNLRRYNGKILRLNLDGSIPSDNPDFGGIGRSHVYSIGHRNPQGLAFERDANNQLIPNGKLYSSEQGPATNDEVNIIYSGRNYGWPRVAGKQDNNWYKYYQWSNSGSCGSYPGECSSTQTNFGLAENSFPAMQHTNPIFDLYPGTPSGGTSCNWLTNPTLAPASIVYYPYTDKIPGWGKSLLISTLKTSSVYLLRLDASGESSKSVSDSVVRFFKEAQLNRYRDIVVANDGITFYLLTDSVGGTSGPSAGMDGGLTNRGSVVEYIYTGPLLSIETPGYTPIPGDRTFRMFPNPASTEVIIDAGRNVSKPVYYEVYDMLGRPVLKGKRDDTRFTLNITTLKKGVYSFKLYNGWDILIATEKLIVQ